MVKLAQFESPRANQPNPSMSQSENSISSPRDQSILTGYTWGPGLGASLRTLDFEN